MKPNKSDATEPAPSTCPAENNATFNLCKLIKMLNRKKILTVKWLQKIGMLNRETACDYCGRPMTLVHRQNCTGARSDKYDWECTKCRMCTKSLRSGTVFQSSKVSLQKITILMYFWAHDFPPHVAQRELVLTERTVNKWYLLCQEACMDALIRNTSKLGGEGRHLEVVEGKLGKRSMDTYRTPAEHPVIGVIDVDTGSCFLQVVISNTKATLLTLLKERIANGSTLHSKCWRVRNCFSDEKFCKVVRTHKLTLSNEDRNTFQKLHDKVCKSGDRVGTLVSFDPLLCATIYKNAMRNEDFFFVKFLGELGSLYRDGIRYELNQSQQTISEPGPSTQQGPTVNTSENTEWTSSIRNPCNRCLSKQYSNSEVQATEEITIEDVDEPQTVSAPKQKVRKSGNLSKGCSVTWGDIIVLDDTSKAQNGITSEQTVPSGNVRHKRAGGREEVTDVEQSDKRTIDSGSEQTASSSSHNAETDSAEVNEVSVSEKPAELPNCSAGETGSEASGCFAEVEGSAVSPDGDCDPQNAGRVEAVAHASAGDAVVDTGGEVSTDAASENGGRTEEATNGGQCGEMDISVEEQIDADRKVGGRETGETSVAEGNVRTCVQEDVRGDVGVMDGGDLCTEAAARGRPNEETIIVYEERDIGEEGSTITLMRPCDISRLVNGDRLEANMSNVKGPPIKMIVLTTNYREVAPRVNTDGVQNIANECTVKDNQTNESPDGERDENSDLVNIDKAVDTTNECTEKEPDTNAEPDGKGDAEESAVEASETSAGSDLANVGSANLASVDIADLASVEGADQVNVDGADLANVEGAEESTVKDANTSAEELPAGGGKTSGADARKREAVFELVNIDDAEDVTDVQPAKRSKTGETSSRKEDATCDLVDIDSVEDVADVHPAKRRKMGETTSGKQDATCDLVDIDSVEDVADVHPAKCSKTTSGKQDATCDLVDIDSAENVADVQPAKSSKTGKTASSKEDATCDLVDIDDTEDDTNECTVKHGRTTVGKKRDSAADLVNTGVAEDSAGECPVKHSKTTPIADSKTEAGPSSVTIDDNVNEREDVPGKRNETAKRKSDTASDIVNIDDKEDSSNEPKGVLSKMNGRSVSEVVNIDDTEDSAGEHGGRLGSANRTHRKESATIPDVIDIDEVDSDVEVIETETTLVPDVMVVGEERRKLFEKDESPRHERRLLVDNVPCKLPKSVLRVYFAQFGHIDYLKILPIPSRRSMRYAELVFRSKQVVDTIQATRPHVLESGVKLVTFRGSSPDIDSSLNTRLNGRIIVKVQRNNMNLTTEDMQQYFSQFGSIYNIERVTLTGMESGSSTFVVGFEDYDSADVACLNSPHTIRGVEYITCEKVEDDDLLLSGTKMDPICIENDSDVEEIQVDEMKAEPSPAAQSQEEKAPDELPASGRQSGGGKRRSEEAPTPRKRKRFRSYNTSERNARTAQKTQKTSVADPTAVANGRFSQPAVPGGSGYTGRSAAYPWHTHGRPLSGTGQAPQRPLQAAPAAGAERPGGQPAAARRLDGFQKQPAGVRTYLPQAQGQSQMQTYRAPFQSQTLQWRRPPPPAHFQPRRGPYSWTAVKREPPSPAVPQHRVLTGVPITSSGFSGPSHVTRTRPPPPTPGPANTRSFIPRATGSQGPRF